MRSCDRLEVLGKFAGISKSNWLYHSPKLFDPQHIVLKFFWSFQENPPFESIILKRCLRLRAEDAQIRIVRFRIELLNGSRSHSTTTMETQFTPRQRNGSGSPRRFGGRQNDARETVSIMLVPIRLGRKTVCILSKLSDVSAYGTDLRFS